MNIWKFRNDLQKSYHEFSAMVKNGSKLFYLGLFEEEGPLPELYIPPILLPPDTTLLSPYGNIRNMSQLTIQVTDAISVSCVSVLFLDMKMN